MGRVLTNSITLQVANESTLGVQPTTGWKTIEPNSVGKFGPTLTKMSREPISKNRQRRKGALVDLDSTVEFEVDYTYDHVKMFVEGLFFSALKGATTTFTPTAVTATGYTVASGGALANDTLVRARGFANAANNGLKKLAGTSTGTEIKTTGLVIESPVPAGATIEVCGVQLAAGDADIDASGDLTTTLFNWVTGSAIQPGQFIWIGGDSSTALLNFSNSLNRGLARVDTVAAGKLTLNKTSTTFAVEANTTSTLQIFWGSFVRNVSVESADYLERTFHFELAYENLGSTPGTDEYEYAQGNFLNEVTFDFPGQSKAMMKCGFVGTNCGNPTTVRATGASAATPAVATAALNTSADFVRLRVTNVDESGLTTDFKTLSVMIKNNVTPEKVLGVLGGRYMNAGMFEVEIDATVLFTSSDVIKAMRDNRTVTMEVGARNDDGGFVIDVPSMTIEGGDKEFPVNQTVSISMKSLAFQDTTFGSSASMSIFPYLPSA